MGRALRRLAPTEAAHEYTNKLLLTMGSPHEALSVKRPVDSLTAPGREGSFTVTNNHSQLVSQLQAGKITIKDAGKEEHYFISDGFLFFNQPTDGSGCCTVEVSGVEIVPTDMLDKDRAAQMLTELNAGAKESEWDKARIALGSSLLSQVIKTAP